MTIYKSDGKKGFAATTNLINRENLTAAGLTAAIAAVMLLVVKGSPIKKTKADKSRKKDKKGRPKGALKTLILPTAFRLAKSAVSQGKLQGILKKVNVGEDIGINISLENSNEEEVQKENKPVTVCGLEIIEPINIGSEEEIYEHLR